MEKNLIILLIISILLLISILIIINLIIINKNEKIRKIVIDYNYNNDINYPSLLVLNNKGRYTTTIENDKDKIMLVYGDRRYIKYIYIDINNCQIIDKNSPSTTIIIKSGLKDLRIFSFNYRLYISAKYKDKMRILSIQMKRTYKTKLDNGYYFMDGERYMVITEDFRIYEIDDINFKIKEEIGQLNINKSDIIIETNPIKVNNEWIMICINGEGELILIKFELENLMIKMMNKIDIEEKIRANGIIYNKITNEIYISTMNNNRKMVIYKIKYI